MSSAINHKKRSRYSEQRKGGAFAASSRRAIYNDAYRKANQSVMARLFHRRAPKGVHNVPAAAATKGRDAGNG